MTALGKILVFMNLAFSVLTGGLIVMVFLTRTNWKTEHDVLVARLETLGAQANDQLKQSASAKNDAEQRAFKAQSDLTAKQNELADAEQKLQTATEDLAKLKKQSTTDSLLTAGTTANLDTIKKERDDLKANLAKLQVAIEGLTADSAKDREKAVLFEQKFIAMQQRANDLLTKLTAAEDALANAKRNGVVTAMGEKPAAPSQSMRGTVQAIDGNLLTVSVGSDNGLKKDNTLKVYRLEPEPVYLGTLTVQAVRAKDAVGRFEPAASAKRTPLKVGDQVADKIQ